MRWALGLLLISRLAVAGADSTFAAGQTAFHARDFVTAAAQLEVFVHTFSNDARIGVAVITWLTAIQNVQPFDPPRLNRAIEEAFALPNITGSDRVIVVSMYDGVLDQQIRALLLARDPNAAAKLGEQRVALAPNPRTKLDRIFSAFGNYQSANDVAGARRMLQMGIAVDPTHHLVQAMRLQLGDLEQATDPEDAATNYLAAAGWCHNCADYSEYRLVAADLFLALGEPRKAYDAAASYLADFPANAHYGERAALLVVDSAAKISTALSEQADIAYLKRSHPIKAAAIWLHLGLIAQQRGERATSEQALANAIKLTELDDQKAGLYGQALLARAEWLARDTARISLAVASTKITDALRDRTHLLELALAAYEEVAGSKDLASTIAAIDRSAHVYEEYAAALSHTEPLASDNDAERMAYRSAIAAFTVKDTALTSYQTAYEMALANNLHDAYSIDAFQQLQRLDPKNYPATPHDPLRNGELEQDARLDAGR